MGILDRVARPTGRADDRSSSPSTAARPAGPASASRWAPARRPATASTSRSPRCSRTAATTSPSRPGATRGAGVRRRAGAAAAPGGGAGRRARHRARAAQMGREMDVTDIRELLYRNLEHPRWDDGRRPLPDLRQLHDGVPDLLLHDGRGDDRPHRRARRAPPALGLVLHGRLLAHARRQRARSRARATASG